MDCLHVYFHYAEEHCSVKTNIDNNVETHVYEREISTKLIFVLTNHSFSMIKLLIKQNFIN